MMPISFIESPFTTKVQYDEYVKSFQKHQQDGIILRVEKVPHAQEAANKVAAAMDVAKTLQDKAAAAAEMEVAMALVKAAKQAEKAAEKARAAIAAQAYWVRAKECDDPRAAQAKERAHCPWCQKPAIAMGGGSAVDRFDRTRGYKYAYKCENSHEWQQNCDKEYKRRRDCGHSHEDALDVRPTKRGSRCSYKCSKCGEPKKGHVCAQA